MVTSGLLPTDSEILAKVGIRLTVRDVSIMQSCPVRIGTLYAMTCIERVTRFQHVNDTCNNTSGVRM